MNDTVKQIVREKLLKAIKDEGITQREAAMFIGISQYHVSVIKTQNPEIKVPDDVWEKVRTWTNSGYTLIEYPRHHPEAALKPKGEIDPVADALWQQSVDNVDKANKALKAVIEKGELKIPEHISEGIPASDNEIEDRPLENEDPTTEGLFPYILRRDKEERESHVIDFIEANASKIKTRNGKTYYYMPYWFTFSQAGIECTYIDQLPEEVKEAINKLREGIV